MHIRKTRLLTPGPTPLYPPALHAMMGSDIHHRTEDFRNLYRATLADLAGEIPAAPWPEGDPADPARPGLDLVEVLVLAGTAASRGEARRLVEQGGVHVNGRPARDPEARFTTDDLLAGRFLLVRRGKRDQRLLVRGQGRA